MDLDRSDLDTLIEAVEAWESKDAFGELMGVVFEAIAGPRDRYEREAWLTKRAAEREARSRDLEDTRRVRKERSVLLRAKLIAIRDRIEVETFGATR